MQILTSFSTLQLSRVLQHHAINRCIRLSHIQLRTALSPVTMFARQHAEADRLAVELAHKIQDLQERTTTSTTKITALVTKVGILNAAISQRVTALNQFTETRVAEIDALQCQIVYQREGYLGIKPGEVEHTVLDAFFPDRKSVV